MKDFRTLVDLTEAAASIDGQANSHKASHLCTPAPAARSPNFFIVGAAKAGTTSLHTYLSGHSDVFMSPIKEPHYFASFERTSDHDNFLPVIRDARAYQDLFWECEGQSAVGESSPSYLCDEQAATRIHLAVPDARIIISLRDPVERAHSHYLMEHRAGRESRPLQEALVTDLARKQKGWGVSFQYVELGLYYQQVERFLSVFGRDRVLILLFQEVTQDTWETMRKVARFLNIDPDSFSDVDMMRAYNHFEESRGPLARKIIRSKPIRVWSKRLVPQTIRTAIRNRFLFKPGCKPELDPETHRFLRKIFEDDLVKLEQLLDRDLGALRETW